MPSSHKMRRITKIVHSMFDSSVPPPDVAAPILPVGIGAHMRARRWHVACSFLHEAYDFAGAGAREPGRSGESIAQKRGGPWKLRRVFLIGSRKLDFKSTYTLRAEFANAGGLVAGADVRVGGIHRVRSARSICQVRPAARSRSAWIRPKKRAAWCGKTRWLHSGGRPGGRQIHRSLLWLEGRPGGPRWRYHRRPAAARNVATFPEDQRHSRPGADGRAKSRRHIEEYGGYQRQDQQLLRNGGRSRQ